MSNVGRWALGRARRLDLGVRVAVRVGARLALGRRGAVAGRRLRALARCRCLAVCGGEALGQQALGALAPGARVAIDGAQQALGLAAVVLGQARVVFVADLADRALVLEILQGAQHGALLLFLGARRAEAERLFQRDRRVAAEALQAGPDEPDAAEEHAAADDQQAEPEAEDVPEQHRRRDD